MPHYDRDGDCESYPRKHVPDAVAQKGGNKTECAQRREKHRHTEHVNEIRSPERFGLFHRAAPSVRNERDKSSSRSSPAILSSIGFFRRESQR